MEQKQSRETVITGHYRLWAEKNVNSWVLSDKYFEFWAREVSDILHLKTSDRLCDLGSGNGRLASQIARHINLDNPIICVEPSHEIAQGENPLLEQNSDSAELFLKHSEDASFDKVLIKQSVHHFTISADELASLLWRMLMPGGCVLILTMPPTIEYPTFKAVRDEFQKHQVNFGGLEKSFVDAGFAISKGYKDYEVDLARDDYFEAIRARYISDLAKFSASEIEMGITEMAEEYGNPARYKFSDRLCYFLFTKPVSNL